MRVGAGGMQYLEVAHRGSTEVSENQRSWISRGWGRGKSQDPRGQEVGNVGLKGAEQGQLDTGTLQRPYPNPGHFWGEALDRCMVAG